MAAILLPPLDTVRSTNASLNDDAIIDGVAFGHLFEECPSLWSEWYKTLIAATAQRKENEGANGTGASYSLTNSPADRAIASITVNADMAINEFVLKDGKVFPANVADYDEVPGSSLVWSVTGTTLTISGNGPMPDYADADPPYQGYAGTITAIVVEEGVTQVGDNAFQGFEGVTTVSLPETLTSIGIGAFADCASLDNVVIPDSVETLGEGAFSGCDSLGMLYLPQRFVPYIDDLGIPDTCSVANTDVYHFVRRLYNLCLGREPEWSGCATWSKRLTSGEKDGAMAAFGFCLSAEMERRNLSNGKKKWLGQLNSGVSRDKVMASFYNSNEFATIMAGYGIK